MYHVRYAGGNCPQAGIQLTQIKGLDQIIICPGIQAGNSLLDGIAGGENQYRKR